MNGKERFRQFLAGEAFSEGVPAAFFQHFGPTRRHGDAALQAQMAFYRATEMDMVKIMFDDIYPAIQGIGQAKDWAGVPRFSQQDPVFTQQIELAKRVVEAVDGSAPVFQTIFSPFVSAGCAVSPILHWDEKITPHLAQEPAIVRDTLEGIADVLAEFAHRIASTGIDGFYVSLQGGEYSRYPQEFFLEQLKPTDLMLLRALQSTGKLVFLHICGTGMRLEDYYDYPGDIVNLAVHGNQITLAQAVERFARPVMGGLDNNGCIVNGTREEIEAEVRRTLRQAPAGCMLGADCTIPIDVPVEHLAWAVQAAHSFIPEEARHD